jgi:hypothetical protein
MELLVFFFFFFFFHHQLISLSPCLTQLKANELAVRKSIKTGSDSPQMPSSLAASSSSTAAASRLRSEHSTATNVNTTSTTPHAASTATVSTPSSPAPVVNGSPPRSALAPIVPLLSSQSSPSVLFKLGGLPNTPSPLSPSRTSPHGASAEDLNATPRSARSRHRNRSRERRGYIVGNSALLVVSPRRSSSVHSPRRHSAIASPRHRSRTPRARNSLPGYSNASEAEDAEAMIQRARSNTLQTVASHASSKFGSLRGRMSPRSHHSGHHQHHAQHDDETQSHDVAAAAAADDSSVSGGDGAAAPAALRAKQQAVSRAMAIPRDDDSATGSLNGAVADGAPGSSPSSARGNDPTPSSARIVKKKKKKVRAQPSAVARVLDECLLTLYRSFVWTPLALDRETKFDTAVEYRARVRGFGSAPEVMLVAQGVEADTLYFAFRGKQGVIDCSALHTLRVTAGAASATSTSASLVEPRHAVVSLEARAAALSADEAKKQATQTAMRIESLLQSVGAVPSPAPSPAPASNPTSPSRKHE